MAIPSWEIPWIFNMTATKIHCAGATVDNKYRIWKKMVQNFSIPLLHLKSVATPLLKYIIYRPRAKTAFHIIS